MDKVLAVQRQGRPQVYQLSDGGSGGRKSPRGFCQIYSVIHDHIDQYNSDVFWDELIHRLTDRDVDKKARVLNRIIESRDDYWELGTPFAEKYANELEENGLNRLEIRET